MSFEKSASRLPANLGCTITWHNTDASVVSNRSCISTVHISYIRYSLEYSILHHGTRNLFIGLKGQVSLLWILPGRDCTHLLSLLCRKLLCLSARHTRLKGVASSIMLFLYFHAFISTNMHANFLQFWVPSPCGNFINKILFYEHSSLAKVKDEKRPWILRAREAAVHVDNTTTEESSETWPETLIYISCGWESFKKVRLRTWFSYVTSKQCPVYTFWTQSCDVLVSVIISSAGLQKLDIQQGLAIGECPCF